MSDRQSEGEFTSKRRDDHFSDRRDESSSRRYRDDEDEAVPRSRKSRQDDDDGDEESGPRTRKRSRREREDSDDAALPSLSKRGSSLSNLGQSARLKQINSARVTLLIIGVLQIGISVFELFSIQGQIADARRQGMVVDDARVNMIRMIVVGFLCAGVTYLILGALVKKFPLPCTIFGLVVFVTVQLIAIAINPAGFASGWIFKVAFLVSFISAIKAAKAYEDQLADDELAAEGAA